MVVAIVSAIVIAGSAGPTALAADPTDTQVAEDWQVWTLEHHDSGSGAYGIVVSPCFDSNC